MTALWTLVGQDANEVAMIINRLEWIGKQMEDLDKTLAGVKNEPGLRPALAEAHKQMRTVERLFLEDQLLASDPKSYREEMAIYQKLLWFAGEIGTGAGDIRNTEDFGPTSQQLEVYKIFKGRIAEARTAFDKLLKETLPAFNKTLQAAGFGPIVF
jgi:glutathione S-transferase